MNEGVVKTKEDDGKRTFTRLVPDGAGIFHD